MDFIHTQAACEIEYAKATNLEYEYYYRETVDCLHEIFEVKEPADGYIVKVNGGVPEWFATEEFKRTFSVGNPTVSEALLPAAKPLMKLLAENFSPHTLCVVTSTDVTIHDEVRRVKTEEFIQDL